MPTKPDLPSPSIERISLLLLLLSLLLLILGLSCVFYRFSVPTPPSSPTLSVEEKPLLVPDTERVHPSFHLEPQSEWRVTSRVSSTSRGSVVGSPKPSTLLTHPPTTASNAAPKRTPKPVGAKAARAAQASRKEWRQLSLDMHEHDRNACLALPPCAASKDD
ncbi:hypothetical protein ACQY0O_001095 [Thecaphora frezii]